MHVNELVQPDKSFLKRLENEVTEIISKAIYQNEYCTYSSKDIATTIFETALQKLSLESNATLPDSDTVFYRLQNSGLSEKTILPMLYNSRPQSYEPIIVLLDGHDDLYYGKRRNREGRKVKVGGTKPTRGASYAFKYLTAKRLNGEVVYTCPLFSGVVLDNSIKIIEELKSSYTILYVIGDGAFPSSILIDYLKSIGLHFVFRYPSTSKLRSRRMRYNVLKKYTTTYKAPYMKRRGTIPVDFYICKYQGMRDKNGKRKDFYIITDQKISARRLRKFLKNRWDIESGFREIEKLTIFTTTRDYILRFFFHVVACIIYNFWIQVRKQFSLRLHDLVLLILRLNPLSIFKILKKRCRYFAISEEKPP
jgi:hypothetical protein